MKHDALDDLIDKAPSPSDIPEEEALGPRLRRVALYTLAFVGLLALTLTPLLKPRFETIKAPRELLYTPPSTVSRAVVVPSEESPDAYANETVHKAFDEMMRQHEALKKQAEKDTKEAP